MVASPAAIEIVITADGEEHETAYACTSVATFKKAKRGLQIARAHLAGRIAGSGTWEGPDAFEAAVIKTGTAILRSGGRPTQSKIAEQLSTHLPHRVKPDCDARRIREWCQHFDRPWPQLRLKMYERWKHPQTVTPNEN
jgi:hypothetical protein